MAPALARALASDGAYPWAVAALVLLALLARLPDAAESSEITRGHPDATSYFTNAYTYYLPNLTRVGTQLPMASAGSGWPLVEAAAFALFRVEGGPPVARVTLAPGSDAGLSDAEIERQYLAASEPVDAQRAVRLAYALSAVLSTAAVALTIALARAFATRAVSLAAGALVAFDPALVRAAGDAMSEPLFLCLLLPAGLFALRARESPWWLAGAGATMALAFTVRFNALTLAPIVLGAGALLAWPRHGARATLLGLAAAALAAALVAAPYLAWRADHLPSALHMGQNGDVWADRYWDAGSYSDPGSPRYQRYVTLEEYRATHTLGDAAARAWKSVWLQAWDFAKQASLPVLALVAFLAWRLLARDERRPALLLPLGVAGMTFASLFWVYPLVATQRYYHPLTPFLAIAGAAALAAWAGRNEDRARTTAWALAATVAVYGAAALARTGAGLAWALAHGDLALLALLGGLMLAGVASAAARGW